jgi:hypothetical protein
MLCSREIPLCPLPGMKLWPSSPQPITTPNELSWLMRIVRFSHLYSSVTKFIWHHFACCLPHTGFLHSFLFNPEEGGDIFLRKLVDFHQTIWYYITEDRTFYVSPILKKYETCTNVMNLYKHLLCLQSWKCFCYKCSSLQDMTVLIGKTEAKSRRI